MSTSTGDVVWRTPLGEYQELTAKGITGTGTAVNDGGPIATASGLVFIGATIGLRVPRLRRQDRQRAVEGDARQRCADDADDVSRRQRQTVRRGGRRRRRRCVSHPGATESPATRPLSRSRFRKAARTSWTDENFFRPASLRTLAAKVLSDATLARARQAPARASGGQAPRKPRRHRRRDADHGRLLAHLHWLRSPDEIAEAAIEMTCGGVQPTVQEFPATSIPPRSPRSCRRS